VQWPPDLYIATTILTSCRKLLHVLEVATSVCLPAKPAFLLGLLVLAINNAREYMDLTKSLPPWFSQSAGCKLRMDMLDTRSNSPCSSGGGVAVDFWIDH
jgi:hypothetical protein